MTNKKPQIVIVDYGIGNLHSIKQAFDLFKDKVEIVISEEAVDIGRADALVLPGVGSFKAGMRGLKLRKLVNIVKDAARQDTPMLGICLGAQLMLSKGEEFGVHEGLNIIPGKVAHFPTLEDDEKVPHIGWNSVYPKEKGVWEGTILQQLKNEDQVYFVHSYVLEPDNMENVLALTRYGGLEFCSAIKKGNIYGCQFHPEKSGEVGLKIIKSFVNLIV